MNTLDAIYSRRSIRNFNGKSMTDAELSEILKAAYAAPVGRARYETLHLTVITNKDLLDRWEKLMQTVVGNPDLHPFYGAPCVILVSSAAPNGVFENVHYSNAAIIVQNMALAATELGVGACHIWGAVGVLGGDAELAGEMNIPDAMVPCCAIALGHFDGKYELREAIDNRIKTNHIH